MNSYKSSTKEQPLLFFESFINKKSLAEYEENFYSYYINRSQEKNLSQGYITYQKDCYEDNDSPKVIEYFVDRLKTLLEREANISYKFLYDRKIAKEYDEVFKNDFINHRISDLDVILEKVKNFTHKDLIIEILDKLRERMVKLRYPNDSISIRAERRGTNRFYKPYFGLMDSIKPRHLRSLYNELEIIGLFNVEEVSEDNFLAVFKSPNPSHTDDRIIFNKDNYHVMALLHFLEPYFDQLTHSRIAKSKFFISKRGHPLTQNILDTTKNRFKSKDISDYKIIQDAILRAMP